MVNEIVARIRGVDRWPETLATVSSVTRYEQPVGKEGAAQSRSCISFWYRDGNHAIQSGEFTVDEDSPLFGQEKDSTFALKYNPARPDRYWSSEYSPTFDRPIFEVLGLLLAAAILFVILEK